MVLRCSLLGHDYGETEVDREREERGSEVVLTVREYEQCKRCGEKHVVSENTEVTSIASSGEATAPDEPIADATADERVADAAAEEPTDAGVPAGTDEPAGANGPTDESTADAPVAEGDEDDGIPTDENGDPITDDAEILEETVDVDADRGRGEWPDSEDVGPPVGADAEPAAWPDDGDEVLEFDEGDASEERVDEETTDDAVFVDAEPPEPEVTDAGTGIASAGSAPAPGESTTPEDVPTEFFCPQCSFVAPGDRGSLRSGDICPECRKGYLGERER